MAVRTATATMSGHDGIRLCDGENRKAGQIAIAGDSHILAFRSLWLTRGAQRDARRKAT